MSHYVQLHLKLRSEVNFSYPGYLFPPASSRYAKLS